MYFEIGVLKKISNFTGKINVLDSLFKKASGFHAGKFFKKRLQEARFSRAIFSQNTSGGWF